MLHVRLRRLRVRPVRRVTRGLREGRLLSPRVARSCEDTRGRVACSDTLRIFKSPRAQRLSGLGAGFASQAGSVRQFKSECALVLYLLSGLVNGPIDGQHRLRRSCRIASDSKSNTQQHEINLELGTRRLLLTPFLGLSSVDDSLRIRRLFTSARLIMAGKLFLSRAENEEGNGDAEDEEHIRLVLPTLDGRPCAAAQFCLFPPRIWCCASL